MSTSYAGYVKVQVQSKLTDALDLSSIVDSLQDPALQVNTVLTDGTGANKAQVHWHDRRTVTAGANDDLDLAGVLKNAFGTVTVTVIKAILIRMVSVTSGMLLNIGAAASNPITTLLGGTTPTETLGAGGLWLKTAPVDGHAITGGSADVLRVNNPGGASVTYDIVVIGEGTIA